MLPARLARALAPALGESLYKGRCGRVAVVGGCEEYTGAPFYAAMASLKGGADLAFVVCTPPAAIPIKCYSPELIVYPTLLSGTDGAMRELMQRCSAVVVGSGLGRSAAALEAATAIIRHAAAGAGDAPTAAAAPLIIDGDGLFLLSRAPELVRGCRRAVLTLNAMEFKRLWDAVMVPPGAPAFDMEAWTQRPADHTDVTHAQRLADALGNVVVVQKGKVDVISDGVRTLTCATPGAPRRCGGQGDVLAGLTALYASWVCSAGLGAQGPADAEVAALQQSAPLVAAAAAACHLTRSCARAAFAAQGRAMTAPDLLAALPGVLRSEVGE